MSLFSLSFLLLAAYVLGSLPFAVITSKLFGLEDPRRYGSGNPGATNVLRSGNKGAAVLTLIGDCLKGWLAVWLASKLGFTPLEAACAGLFALLGHIFSVFLRFKGGKGVATALGVMIGVDIQLAVLCALVWLTVAFVTRYSSAAALAAAAAAPISGLMFLGPHPIVLVLLTMAGLLFWRHAANIARLSAGTEGKIGGGKKTDAR